MNFSFILKLYPITVNSGSFQTPGAACKELHSTHTDYNIRLNGTVRQTKNVCDICTVYTVRQILTCKQSLVYETIVVSCPFQKCMYRLKALFWTYIRPVVFNKIRKTTGFVIEINTAIKLLWIRSINTKCKRKQKLDRNTQFFNNFIT